MARLTVAMPKLISGPKNGPVILKPRLQEIATYGALASSTPTFKKNGLLSVTVTGGVSFVHGIDATAIAAANSIWGMALNDSRGIAGGTSRLDLNPPAALNRDFMNAIDLRDAIIEVTIGPAAISVSYDGSTSEVAGSTVPPGTQIGLYATGAGILPQCVLGCTTAATKAAEVLRLAPGVSTTDTNPRVWIRLLEGILKV